MVSKSKFRKSLGEQGSDDMASLSVKLTQLKRQIQSERIVFVGEKVEKNCKSIQSYVSHLKDLADSRTDSTVTTTSSSGNLLSLRMNYPLCKFSGLVQGSEDRGDCDSEEIVFSTTAKLPPVERIPPYTTWIFLDRNQRMADDQSVVGRRRIYYDKHGSEALICSDSEEDMVQSDGEKRQFSEGEDRLMRLAFLEYGIGNEVLDLLTEFVGGSSPEIQERCTMLMEIDHQMETQKKPSKQEGSKDNISLDQSLSAALDSFDNLFCRRCLVFDCRLHGCSQPLIDPNEKQPYQFETEEDRKPCGDQCYLQSNGVKDLPKHSDVDISDEHNASDQEDLSPVSAANIIEQEHHLEIDGNAAVLESSNSLDKASKLISDNIPSCSSNKKPKLVNTDPMDHVASLVEQVPEAVESCKNEIERSTSGSVHVSCKSDLDHVDCPQSVTCGSIERAAEDDEKDLTELPMKKSSNSIGHSIKASHRWGDWNTLEKDLYLKGLEIFGRNRYVNLNFMVKNINPAVSGIKSILPQIVQFK